MGNMKTYRIEKFKPKEPVTPYWVEVLEQLVWIPFLGLILHLIVGFYYLTKDKL